MMNFSVFLNVNIAGILAPDPDRFSGPKREDFLGYLKSSDFDFTIHK
jgi:hypothetical protein